MLDILIRGGLVVDGTGSEPFAADVAVEDGVITGVGSLPGAQARRVIDATGLIVSPGLIDPHSHSDRSILGNPTAQSTIRQGVTTEVVGNCGATFAPRGRPRRRSRRAPWLPWVMRARSTGAALADCLSGSRKSVPRRTWRGSSGTARCATP